MTKLKVTPLTGSIGASVEGVDLNSPSTARHSPHCTTPSSRIAC